MSCELCREFVFAATAAELGSPPAPIRQHLDACPECAASAALRVATTAALAGAAVTPGTDAAFAERLQKALRREGARTATGSPPSTRGSAAAPWWKRLLAPSPVWAAAALVLFAFSTFNYLRITGVVSPAGQTPADMARLIADVGHDVFLYTRNEQTLEIASSDPAAVESWFSDRLDAPVVLPRRVEAGYEIEGARLWHTVGRLAALVRYRPLEGAEPVTLFVVSADHMADRGGRKLEQGGCVYRAGEAFDHHVVAWRSAGAAYALVGKGSERELLQLAADFPRSSD